MNLLRRTGFLLNISGSHHIIRRYFVVNGFDGALTMLGLIMGFTMTGSNDLDVIISACLGAAIALGISGISSAYISEQAERSKAFAKLEQAMITDLEQSAHGRARQWVPLLTGLVNGSSPLLISLLIISPLWLAESGVALPFSPINTTLAVALIIIFFLGVFLGRIANVSWWYSGIRTSFIAVLTIGIIYLIGSG